MPVSTPSNREIFILLKATNKECSKIECDNSATHILIGKEHEFLGFYCEVHGRELQETLEAKYQFNKENKFTKPKTKRKKSWRNYMVSPKRKKK